VAENLIQALAAIVIREQMVRIGQRYPLVCQVHDEIVVVVPEAQAEEAQRFVEAEMSTAPKWAPGLPVACESGYAFNYGDT
jgi:DNA polymerase I-like protein with 3'-5' exonuclease and polymerase domains